MLLSSDQWVALGIFFLGIIILNFCARLERQDLEVMRDPRYKWAYIDGEKEGEKKVKSIRGTILTFTGVGLALYGFITFLMSV